MRTTERLHWMTDPSGRPHVIDKACPAGDGLYCGMTESQIKLTYPGAKLTGEAEYWEAHDNFWKTTPVEIQEEEFHAALDALPPIDMGTVAGVTSFKFREILTGDLTTIYARGFGRYWSYVDSVMVSASDVAERIEGAAKA